MKWWQRLFGRGEQGDEKPKRVQVKTVQMPFEGLPEEIQQAIRTASETGSPVMLGGKASDEVMARNTRLMAIQLVQQSNPGAMKTDDLVNAASKIEQYIMQGTKPAPVLKAVESNSTEK